MIWIAGIDEAGYGPTLGPLVISLASIEAPAALSAADGTDAVRHCLRSAVCRRPGRFRHRIPIDDSKRLYTPGQGIARLEESVLGCLAAIDGRVPATFDELLRRLGIEAPDRFDVWPWYRSRSLALPRAGELTTIQRYASALRSTLEHEGTRLRLHTNPVDETRFNAGVGEHGNKANALVAELLRLLRAVSPRGMVHDVRVDRLGGRVYYADLLREAYVDCEVRAVRESSKRSEYRVASLFRTMRFDFRQNGDRHEMLVALASMVSKYVRELFMEVFNTFWREHVDDVRPTAGYPVDAQRFLASIRSACASLGIEERDFVRSR